MDSFFMYHHHLILMKTSLRLCRYCCFEANGDLQFVEIRTDLYFFFSSVSSGHDSHGQMEVILSQGVPCLSQSVCLLHFCKENS